MFFSVLTWLFVCILVAVGSFQPYDKISFDASAALQQGDRTGLIQPSSSESCVNMLLRSGQLYGVAPRIMSYGFPQHHHGKQQSNLKCGGVLGFDIDPQLVSPSAISVVEKSRSFCEPIGQHLSAVDVAGACRATKLTSVVRNSRSLPDSLVPRSGSVEEQTCIDAHQQRPFYALRASQLRLVCESKGLPSWGGRSALLNRLYTDQSTFDSPENESAGNSDSSWVPDSLQQWSRLSIDQLLRRREQIHNEVNDSRVKCSERSRDDYIASLNRAFDKPSYPVTNKAVKDLYKSAKAADMKGDKNLYRKILYKLRVATPHDARVVRRLSRLERESGNLQRARSVLLEAVRGSHCQNALMWHALGLLAATADDARSLFKKAIAVDPLVPHSYHALGTLEHSEGNIAKAMSVVKEGVVNVPGNHRLQHALGDLYREAQLVDHAEECYKESLRVGPDASRAFSFTSLAYTAYEGKNMGVCQTWLRRAITANNGRQSSAWVALAQFEEIMGRVANARSICLSGISQYEEHLARVGDELTLTQDTAMDMISGNRADVAIIPPARSGDRFISVYRTLIRLETEHGSVSSVEAAFERAVHACPNNWRLLSDWAVVLASNGVVDRARSIFSEACEIAGSLHAEPYRLYALHEMSQGDFASARQILLKGALEMSKTGDGGLGGLTGMPELFHTWAICEWTTGRSMRRVELLLDTSLRLVQPGPEGSELRAYVLFTLARLQFALGENILAEHCLSLCLHENTMPSGNERVWKLWAVLAEARGDSYFAERCVDEIERLHARDDITMNYAKFVRREPWYWKLFGSQEPTSAFFNSHTFPDYLNDVLR